MSNTFVDAVENQEARTANGMKARKSTTDKVVDLFFKIGASRGKDIVPDFVKAYVQDKDLAARVALWSRDARGGAGERELFRNILVHLETADPDLALAMLRKVPELGRWDDIFAFKTVAFKRAAFDMLKAALESGDGLAAKWTPRKGELAAEIRTHFGWTPKFYRKTLVNLTKVVETQMCANDWDNINFNHVPSVASARYKKAFNRHTTKFADYVNALVKGDPTAKVNAGAVYPYDILKGVGGWGWKANFGQTELDHITAQWAALPNFVGDANILPMVDVSGSMSCPAGAAGYGSKSVTTCMDVAVSLGLYLAEKNQGKFKDTFLTFSGTPELMTLKGNIVQKCDQMVTSKWGMSTNLHAAFDKILSVAVKGNVPQAEMPEMLLILSDMQFDACAKFDNSAMEMIERKYAAAGYTVPQIVFWNLNASDNVPVKSDKSGAALVSGFSPSIVKAVLGADMSEFTPYGIMMKTIMNDRYTL